MTKKHYGIYKAIEHNTTLYLAIPSEIAKSFNIESGNTFLVDITGTTEKNFMISYSKIDTS